jgi:DNA-binding GntR family transcriptional regulator
LPRERRAREDGPASLAAAAYLRLHHDIVNGTLPPGEKLLIHKLCERYEIGLSPVREALNRLAGERLVVHSEQRGFMVAPLSEPDLEDILRARWWLNETGLRASMERGDDAWEERVVLACHWLARTPRYQDQEEVERNPAWQEAHRLFHASLLSASGSNWLETFCEQLFHAFERYRYLSRLAARTSPLHQQMEHSAIMEAAISRRAEDAVRLLREHFDKTARLVRKQLSSMLAPGKIPPPGGAAKPPGAGRSQSNGKSAPGRSLAKGTTP